MRDYLPAERSFPHGAELIFWSGLALIALAPVVAIWRNLSALALLYAQVTTAGHPQGPKLAPVVETCLKAGGGLLLILWLGAILPTGGMARWLPLVALIVVAVAGLVLRRRLVYWHSRLEVELHEMLAQGDQKFTGTTAPWMAAHSDWNLTLTDCVLPDLADCRGRTLGELALRSKFGCTVAGVERQGVMAGNPTSTMVLYPRDKVLLLGDPKQVASGKDFLQSVSGSAATSNFDEVRMEAVTVPAQSELDSRSLAELALSRSYGLQVAGIKRGGRRVLNPGSEEKLFAGDDILVLGSPDQIAAFKAGIRRE